MPVNVPYCGILFQGNYYGLVCRSTSVKEYTALHIQGSVVKMELSSSGRYRKMKRVSSSETLVPTYHRCHTPENNNICSPTFPSLFLCIYNA